jgi:hypothetical protein
MLLKWYHGPVLMQKMTSIGKLATSLFTVSLEYIHAMKEDELIK